MADKESEKEEVKAPITMDEVNAAFTSREKRLVTQFEKKMAEVVAPFAEVLKAKEATPEVVETTPPTKGEPEWKARLREMENRVIAAEKSAKDEKAAREEERKARLVEEERNHLVEALRTNGVDDKRIRGAVALLYTEEKRIVRDEQGNIKYKIPKDGYTDLEDVKTAIAGWVQTDEGKAYLPPRPAAGSGAAPQGRPPKSVDGKKSAAEKTADLSNALTSWISGSR